MARQTRRVITGHDASGKAIVVADGAAPNMRTRDAGPTATLLWVTDRAPAQVDGVGDAAARQVGVAPPAGGSILRIVDFPPVGADIASLDNTAMKKEMGLDEDHGSKGKPARHPFTHRTRSVDYALVLEGEIDMLLDDSEVHLKAGDVLIQMATNHAWVNNSDKNCRIAFVLVDSDEPEAWKKG
jgi:mannose-6-phosphate isomerase-like protein (cupin superfamily)